MIRLARLSLLVGCLGAPAIAAQDLHYGAPIPAVHRTMFDRALDYLADTQQDSGGWESKPGVTAICVMALVASGEDPNFGKYADPVRKGLRYILRNQDEETGYIRQSMYEHGFAMLALADCYGAVDDRMLWHGEEQGRTLGEALELAVRCAVTSQENNPFNAWRYSPDALDADTSVAGAVMMGLLGARNAGIAVPDEAIDKGIDYFVSMTLKSGAVGYSGAMGLGESDNRSAITALVLAIAKRSDLETFDAVKDYVSKNQHPMSNSWPCYNVYYVSQALFQVDYPAWRKWTKRNTAMLAELQRDDGSIPSRGGAAGGLAYQTGMHLLSAGLNYCLLPIYER